MKKPGGFQGGAFSFLFYKSCANIIPMHRFFSKNLKENQKMISISDSSEIYHLKKVLRLNVGASVAIFNGQGIEAQGKIIKVSNAEVQIKIEKMALEKRTGPILTLACAIPKKSKFETIIEKCTELGVDEIIPLQTKRTEVKLNRPQAQKKLIRYQSVATNASKQSQRTTVPNILPVTDFKNALNQITANTTALIGCLNAKREPLKTIVTGQLGTKERIIFFIGPEGDFTDDEIKLALSSGCIPIDLGKTVLKVDTAAIAAISFARLILYS